VIKKLGLAAGATVVALVIAEFALRLAGTGAPVPTVSLDKQTASRVDAGVFVFDRDLLWREPSGPPDAAHRDGHFVRVGDTLPRADGRTRILVLGDSCARLSRTNAPWSVRLQQLLGPDRVVVRNASLPGYTSWQGLAWLKKQLLAWNPDVVVVEFGWNDHWRAAAWPDKDWARVLDPHRIRLLGLTRLRPREKPLRVSPADYRANLREIAGLVQRHGGRTVVILPPRNINAANTAKYLENRNILPGDDPSALHEEYLDTAREAAVGAYTTADAAGWFAAVAEPRLLLEADGIHPTDGGHELLARMLTAQLGGASLPDPAAAGAGVLAQAEAAAGNWAEAVRLYRKAVAAAPDDVGPALGLAWLLATCPDDAVRDGDAAVRLVDAAGGGNADALPAYHDVRAAALAATGRFAEARTAEARALELLAAEGQAEGDFAASLQARQALYAQDKPFRLPAPAAGR